MSLSTKLVCVEFHLCMVYRCSYRTTLRSVQYETRAQQRLTVLEANLKNRMSRVNQVASILIEAIELFKYVFDNITVFVMCLVVKLLSLGVDC